MGWLAWLLGALAVAGMAYQVAAAVALRRFAALAPSKPAEAPPVSVLKPLCGDEPGLLDNLRSLAAQDYPTFQVVFGVQDPADPALGEVERLKAEFPALAVAVAVDPSLHGANRKVSNLINMAPLARHGVLVVADSDVRVPPHWLKTVVAALEQPGVGLATCLYRARPAGGALGGTWSRLMAMGLNHGFVPAALVARWLGRDDGCFGQTMAFDRSTLEALGGFNILSDRLADDYDLGAAVRAGGGRIALAPVVIDVVVHEPDLPALFRHELRWERTLALLAPLGHAASVVAQPVALALLSTAVNPVVGLPFLAAALAVRLAAVAVEERALGLPAAPGWLVLARDLLAFAVFVASRLGRSVSWRGHRFRLARDGTLEGSAP